MDPVARSAAQIAAKKARNASRPASPAPEERQGSVGNDKLMGTLDIEPEEVRYFIFCLIGILLTYCLVGYSFAFIGTVSSLQT